MGFFVYTSDSEQKVLDIGVTEARRSAATTKVGPKSLGGAMEVIKQRTEYSWAITFEPVSGERLTQLREFLDATDGGERFTADIYGTASAPLVVKRTDDGYEEVPFMRLGAIDRDYFEISIQVTQV